MFVFHDDGDIASRTSASALGDPALTVLKVQVHFSESEGSRAS